MTEALAAVLPSAGVLAAFGLACFVLFITPGPDMSLWLAMTVAGGRSAGILSMLGTQAGTLVHTLFAAIGLSALVAASATAFTAVKLVGAGYLLWLAIDAIRNGSTLRLRDTKAAPVSGGRAFLNGIAVNLANPKVVLFFVTFLPQFVDPGQPNVPGRLLFLGLLAVAIFTPLGLLFVLGAERAIGVMTRRPRIMRAVDYAFAGIFGLFALRIATMQGR